LGKATQGRKNLFWLTVSEGSVHGHLARVSKPLVRQSIMAARIWQSRAAHIITAKKQKKDEDEEEEEEGGGRRGGVEGGGKRGERRRRRSRRSRRRRRKRENACTSWLSLFPPFFHLGHSLWDGAVPNVSGGSFALT
jgi:hypothetical protein